MVENYQQLNGIVLAYIGDAIYEVAVRQHLLESGIVKPNKLHRTATHYVSAKAQAALVEQMLAQEMLTETEQMYFKRGRNAKSHTSAKNTSVLTYRISTGFESLMGYLHLSQQEERLNELINWCFETIESDQVTNKK